MTDIWLVKTLDELCDIARGGSPRPIKEFFTDEPEGVNWIKISDATASSKYIYKTKQKIKPEGISRSRLVHEGDFLLSNSMSFGRPYIMRTSGCIHDGWLVLGNISETLDQDYLYHFLGSPEAYQQFDDRASGSTVRNLNIDLVRSVQVPVPPIGIQKRIVAILDEAFVGIDLAIANTEKNLANARELFDSYLNSIFMQKDKGWAEIKLEELTVKITKGSSPKWQGVNYVEKPGILFVTSENVDTNKMNYKKTKFVEEVFNEKDSKSILNKGDVLTNIVGASIGRTAVFDRDDVANINQAVCLIRCDKDKLINTYLSYLLNSPYFKKILHDNEIDNARANLSLGFFRSLTIPVPEIIEQEQLILEINALSIETQRLEIIYQQKLNSLNELKKSLLKKAFSGELTAEPDKRKQEAAA